MGEYKRKLELILNQMEKNCDIDERDLSESPIHSVHTSPQFENSLIKNKGKLIRNISKSYDISPPVQLEDSKFSGIKERPLNMLSSDHHIIQFKSERITAKEYRNKIRRKVKLRDIWMLPPEVRTASIETNHPQY